MTPNSIILWSAVIVYAVAQALIIIQAFRFRRVDNGQDTHWHGSIRIDLLWTLIPAILLLAVVIYTIRTIGFGTF